ncbi:MAG: hypothetical protein ACXWCC_18320 [Caldimonas sp.]
MATSLLEKLGLPAVDGTKKAGARPLTSGDFPVDANRRKLADEEAKKKGKAILNAKEEKPGKPPGPGAVDKELDKKVDELLGDSAKKLRQLSKDTMPTFDLFEEMTPEREFAEDLEKGIKNATEQVKFIKQTIEYAEKFGDKTALTPISEASKNLKKVTDGVLGGLGKAAKVAKLGKEVVIFFQALQSFAEASETMSASQGESVAAWVKSLQSVWNAGKPFVDRLKDEVFTAALAGSEAAGALGATLAIVGAELFIGLKALEAGVNVVNAYFKRLHELTKEDNDRVVARPAPPYPPLPFSTRAETIASIKKHEADQKRLKALREKNAEDQKKEESTAQLVEQFNEATFPKIYIGYRKKIKALIYAAYVKKGGGGGSDESDWWDCLRPLDESSDGAWPNDIEPRKDSISSSEAKDEVVQFMALKTPCKFFDAIYQHELKKYLAQQAK